MDSAKNGSWIFPFKIFNMVRVNVIYLLSRFFNNVIIKEGERK